MSDVVQPGFSTSLKSNPQTELDVEKSVRDRYSAASLNAQPELCCPIEYDTQYLQVLPDELIERDYGCGDPSRWVQKGEVVLDLGSGGGKICYIASQIVGPEGRVIGVDMNDEMLELARRFEHEIGERIGWHNVTFHKGRVQDLGLDLRRLEQYLAEHPVRTLEDWNRTQAWSEQLRKSEPLIADNSVDVVLSNCVLNLVDPQAREQLFQELFRVLRPGGRAVISDIVCDESVPERMRNDPHLWSGCISGAHHELEFLHRFEQSGFYGVEVVDRPDDPWATVEGIEFRSVTVRAFKPSREPALDLHQAVIYRGPWSSVVDDDGRVFRRGVRTAVSGNAFERYTSAPYSDEVLPVRPRITVATSAAKPFDEKQEERSPRQTKGATFEMTQLPAGDCCGGDC